MTERRQKEGRKEAERGLTRCATEFTRLATAGLTPCSDGKDAAAGRKGSGSATEGSQGSDGREAASRFVCLLCRSGDSCSVARHWVRPSVASLALLGVTGGSDPLSHRSPERSSV